MAKSQPPAPIDLDDGVALRTYFESLRTTLEGDRSSWDPQWRELAAFFAPRSPMWSTADANRGERKDYQIINETGLLALRTLQAGLLTGLASPTRPWFKLLTDRPELNAMATIRQWCETAADRVRGVFLKANVYQTLLNSFGEEGLYGTTAFLVLDDEKTVIRCHPYPIGSYTLMLDESLRVSGAIRTLTMTPQQMVERYGYDNVSESMQTLYDSNAGGVKETRYEVVHVITKGSYFAPHSLSPGMPWVSVSYEKASYNAKRGVLRRSGFLESPLVTGRWKVTGENTYGESAGMDCLGSVMSLQAWEERLAQAAEKQFNPPMIASSDLDPRRLTTLPGDISFADSKDVSNLFKPAYQVDFRLEGGLQQIQRLEQRINDAMYRTLFQMFSDSDRRDITATEINARMQEKMQVLGPVVERNVEEVLAPLVQRTLSVMLRRGLLPPLPKELQDNKLKIEFISILAQAQKLGGINAISSTLSFAGSLVAVKPDVMDIIDTDAAIREFADLSGIAEKVIRPQDEVNALRQNRDQQQAQAQAADNAQKLAAAANNLSTAHTGTGSLLDQALPALGGGGA